MGFPIVGRSAIAAVAADGNCPREWSFLVQCTMLQGGALAGLVDTVAVIRGLDDATGSSGGCGAGSAHGWFVLVLDRVNEG
mmetsp:Transcript_40873/g.67074  ORF Transcript_40873/g.67074 Transcript_40873/m.67074 type:complete len:81 (+) Transcript_40873:347-589(+)